MDSQQVESGEQLVVASQYLYQYSVVTRFHFRPYCMLRLHINFRGLLPQRGRSATLLPRYSFRRP